MKTKVDIDVMDNKLLRLGFRESLSGTRYLRYAVVVYEPGMSMTKDLYIQVADHFETSPSRVERAMRHAIETAFERADTDEVDEVFGYTIDANKGCPTVSEFVSRMARVCAA